MKLEETIKAKLEMGDILDAVLRANYITLDDGKTTVCQLTMKNGFTVVATSSCVSPANFNRAIGEKVAWDNALEKVWELEGYLLQQKRFEAGLVQ